MEIKAKRELRNLTQEDLAKAMGVGRTAVSMWENGESFPRTDKLLLLASLLGCTVDELLLPKEGR